MSDAAELRAFSIVDQLQPQLASFIAASCTGFLPLEGDTALLVEVSPGIAVNILLDRILKATTCRPGMLVVERAYGLLQVHAGDQGQVREAGRVALEHLGLDSLSALRPAIVSSQTIFGTDNHQSNVINRLSHGQYLFENDAFHILEVHPAAYAAVAANQAEKVAPVRILEVEMFGAYGRVYLGGPEDNIREAADAMRRTIETIPGRPNNLKSLLY
ncbi:MAG TPA: hypothetical protein PKK50_10785 [Myxococcota bacterium]|nr:hypothetical protein [Myxococcota bacterium]